MTLPLDDVADAVADLYLSSGVDRDVLDAAVDQRLAERTRASRALESEPKPKTLFACDVDGVLAALLRSEWPDAVIRVDAMPFAFWFSHSMCTELGKLDADWLWATAWDKDADDVFGFFIGRVNNPYLTGVNSKTVWWKTLALLRYLRKHPEYRRVVWVDDELNMPFSPNDRATNAQTATTLVAELGVELVCMIPENELTPTQVKELQELIGTKP